MARALSYDGSVYDNTVPRFVLIDYDATTGVQVLQPQHVYDRTTGQILSISDQDNYLAKTGQSLAPGERGRAPSSWWLTSNVRIDPPVVQPAVPPGSLWLTFAQDAADRVATPNPLAGQAVLQVDDNSLHVWDPTLGAGGGWRKISGPNAIAMGTLAARPAAGTPGEYYFSTDARTLSAWSQPTNAWIDTPPAPRADILARRPIAGSEDGAFYFATDTQTLFVWDDTLANWVSPRSATTVGPTASRPASPAVGDLYFDTDRGEFTMCLRVVPTVQWVRVS